jgi:hypothetical protein
VAEMPCEFKSHRPHHLKKGSLVMIQMIYLCYY